MSNIHADKILQAGVIINHPMLETYSNEILSNALFLEQMLIEHKILTNYRLLPYALGYGLRLGTSCATIQGLTVDNIPQIVEYFSQALNEEGDTEIIREYISQMIQQSKYDYCYQKNYLDLLLMCLMKIILSWS